VNKNSINVSKIILAAFQRVQKVLKLHYFPGRGSYPVGGKGSSSGGGGWKETDTMV